MDARTQALAAIVATCDEINGQLPLDQRLPTDPTTAEQAVLIGDDGVLDSLGVLNFLMALETRMECDCGWTVSLVGDEALSVERMTVGALATLVAARVTNGAR